MSEVILKDEDEEAKEDLYELLRVRDSEIKDLKSTAKSMQQRINELSLNPHQTEATAFIMLVMRMRGIQGSISNRPRFMSGSPSYKELVNIEGHVDKMIETLLDKNPDTKNIMSIEIRYSKKPERKIT